MIAFNYNQTPGIVRPIYRYVGGWEWPPAVVDERVVTLVSVLDMHQNRGQQRSFGLPEGKLEPLWFYVSS